MTEYLASVPVVAMHSVEEAREAVSRIYLSHDLSSRDGPMNMRFNATTGDQLTLGYLTYQADAELTMPPTGDCYIVNITVAGATRGTRSDGARERTVGNASGLVLSPLQSHRFSGARTPSSCTSRSLVPGSNHTWRICSASR